MTKIRTWIIIVILFLSVVFNLDQACLNSFASKGIFNISLYMLVFFGVILPLLFPALGSLPIFIVPTILSTVYILLQYIVPFPPLLSDTRFAFSTILGIFILIASGILGMLLARALRQTQLSIKSDQSNISSPESSIALEQKNLKDEFLRTRQNNRPIALIILQPELQLLITTRASNPNAGTTQIQPALVYKAIKEAIAKKARISDIAIGHAYKGRFLLSCPDTNKAGAITLMTRLKSTLNDQLGIDIRGGIAIYPDDSLVFEELQQIAEDRLDASVKE